MGLNLSKKAVLLIAGVTAALWGPGVAPLSADWGPLYQEFLDRYVVAEQRIGAYSLNVVDYEGIVASRPSPDSLYWRVLSRLDGVRPETLEGRDEQIAFWINAYNLGAIKTIVDHYPVDSIRSPKIHWLRNPWGIKVLSIGGREYSLREIEHDILVAELRAPMAHFGIVCASLSCPDLSPRAYRGATVHQQLAAQGRRFLRDETRGLRVDRERGRVFFSQIFKFDERSFPGGARDAVPLMAPLLDEPVRDFLVSGDYRVAYLDYDWSVNALARVR